MKKKYRLITKRSKWRKELNMNATVCALSGGEDYELLFTAPLEHYDLLTAMPGISVIGHTCKASEGCYMTTRDGNTFELKAEELHKFFLQQRLPGKVKIKKQRRTDEQRFRRCFTGNGN